MSLLALKEGNKVGPWVLKRKLGEGEYGTVFAGSQDWSFLIIASTNTLGSKEFAIKIAPVNKNRKKNQAAFLISHECTFYRVRFLAFMKDNEGFWMNSGIMYRNSSFSSKFNRKEGSNLWNYRRQQIYILGNGIVSTEFEWLHCWMWWSSSWVSLL